MRTAGRLIVDPDLLARALQLPEGTEILGVTWGYSLNAIDIAIAGPGLPVCEPGYELPRILPDYEQGEGGEVRFIRYIDLSKPDQ